jgi:putative flippase GtrA
MFVDLIQFFKVGAVGVVNTLFDLLIWRTLSNFLEKRNVKLPFVNNYVFAHTISFIFALFLSFYLNKTFAFGDSSKYEGKTFSLFVIISVGSWLMGTVLFTRLTAKDVIPKVHNYIKTRIISLQQQELFISNWPLVAKILVTLVTLISNYFGYKFLVFR